MRRTRPKGVAAVTAKELHKLSRQDLLQLLLAQSREVARQKESIDELKGLLKKERDLSNRLKEKLNEKDEDLARLADKLNEKDENIGRLKEKLNGKDELFERLKHRLDEKDEELNVAQEEARTSPSSPPGPALTAWVPPPLPVRNRQGSVRTDRLPITIRLPTIRPLTIPPHTVRPLPKAGRNRTGKTLPLPGGMTAKREGAICRSCWPGARRRPTG